MRRVDERADSGKESKKASKVTKFEDSVQLLFKCW